ncbi:uncharacterized protein N0V89_005834 [Didymosphaeria variabile]|uniref:pyridoxal 5'-phosphate synthase n=1 Tax=Didymosphaeria variabile TaxID=1932322 RepID=A0A9W8XM38_9PLEO|nr:uncharacterized protein N0V89_005834 [Didymosphaeria variabile]KAJ4354101.1 hypothetical protein N0V89_005834 [Didymosphaeria variabile]
MKTILRALSSLKGPFPVTDLANLPATPHSAFRLWLEDAIEQGEKEPHAMTLSTVDAYGHPDARVLILKNVDSRGWHFATKATSPKGCQIANRPFVAMTFYWPQLGRQIRIRGRAVELPASECASDFLERPDGSRSSAIASKQSQVLLDRKILEMEIGEAKSLLEENPGYVDPAWRVYAVDPVSVEFWQGAEDRTHQRVQYAKESGDNEWTRVALYP